MESRQNSVSPAPRPMSHNFFLDAVSRGSVDSATNAINTLTSNILTTEDSKVKQVGKMILVILVPVLALIVKTSISLSESLQMQNEASTMASVIEHALFASDGIRLLQKERGLTALYMASSDADFAAYRNLASARLNSNDFLLRFTVNNAIQLGGSSPKTLHSSRDILDHLNVMRSMVDRGNSNLTMTDMVQMYTDLNQALMADSLRVALVPSRQTIWPLVVAFSSLARALDTVGVQRAIGGAAFSGCGLLPSESSLFRILNARYEQLLVTAFKFYPPIQRRYGEVFTDSPESLMLVNTQKSVILNNTALMEICRKSGAGHEQATNWFSMVTTFMELFDGLQRNLTSTIRAQVWTIGVGARTDMAIYLTVMISVSTVCLILSVWYSIRLNAMSSKVKAVGLKIQGRAEEVKLEKKKTDFLLYQMMPKRVADNLKLGQEIVPEWFDSVTIYFSDIMDWADLSTKSSPHQIVTLLNNLYKNFDEVIEKYSVYKVETIADSYMCVSGLPEKNPHHVNAIARLSLEMMKFAKRFVITHLPGVPLRLRIGFHSGPCVAGVVGTKMPRYCLFGDTVNTASRMETNGEAFKIHITEASQRLLEKIGGFETTYRGRIPIKGKGEMATYWLERMNSTPVKKRVTITGQSQD